MVNLSVLWMITLKTMARNFLQNCIDFFNRILIESLKIRNYNEGNIARLWYDEIRVLEIGRFIKYDFPKCG